MCGIVGYAGARPALPIVLDGLHRLEYRGYDSAGVTMVGASTLLTCKRAGKLANLREALAGGSLDGGLGNATTGIGHTRWATHGRPTDHNAHPHHSGNGRIAVIHNGIIENFASLRARLEATGVLFASETDTECAAHLLAEELAGLRSDVSAGTSGEGTAQRGRRLAEALRRVCLQLEGAFTLLAVDLDTPDVVVGARRSSPLVVGRGKAENFLASDVAAFIEHTRDAIELGQDQVVLVTPDLVEIVGFDGVPTGGRDYHVDWDASAAQKGGYDYFMLKEIIEQPRAVEDTLRGRLGEDGRLVLDELRMPQQRLQDVRRVSLVACGTAYHAAMVAKYAIEKWAKIPCDVELASEFRYRDPLLDTGTLVVAISQSGETMDTLMALRHARERGAAVLAICNTNGSSIPREADAVLYTHAGPEIAVASTKAFLTQLVACYLVALQLAQAQAAMTPAEISAVLAQLQAMPAAVDRVLDTVEPMRDLAAKLTEARLVLFIGRHVGYPVALEGALKLKELAYMHAEGFAAGELKHGPIALIEEGTPVVCVVPPLSSRLRDKVVSNIQEVRARGALTIIIAEQADEEIRAYADYPIAVPETPELLAPLVATVPLQVLACEIARARGNDVDQPRNLAKSVTVE